MLYMNKVRIIHGFNIGSYDHISVINGYWFNRDLYSGHILRIRYIKFSIYCIKLDKYIKR